MRRFLRLTLLFLGALAAGALLVYPLTIIQPFKRQMPDSLQRALWVFTIAPWTSFAIAMACMGLAVFSWNRFGRVSRAASSILIVLTCLAAAGTRINIFENMFHPAGAPEFVAAEKAKLDPSDMLVTVVLGGDARAYPIREMGYHHVVNDVVGGVPIVATY